MQGATVGESNTIICDAMDAAGIYVGMTRGRNSNRLHLVASGFDDAREQFVLAMERDRADRGLAHATAAARESIRGLATGNDRLQRIARLPAVTAFERNGGRMNPPRSGLNR